MSANTAVLCDQHRIPTHLRGGLIRYFDQAIRPGGFLLAVLSNDLSGAFARGDVDSLAALPALLRLLADAEETAWGSPERVDGWLKRKEAEFYAS